jgi:hypothetical protein
MFALRIVAQATVSVPVRARAQSRQARQDSAIRSPFPPFVISVIFAVTPTRAIPFATLRLCEKHSAGADNRQGLRAKPPSTQRLSNLFLLPTLRDLGDLRGEPDARQSLSDFAPLRETSCRGR